MHVWSCGVWASGVGKCARLSVADIAAGQKRIPKKNLLAKGKMKKNCDQLSGSKSHSAYGQLGPRGVDTSSVRVHASTEDNYLRCPPRTSCHYLLRFDCL